MNWNISTPKALLIISVVVLLVPIILGFPFLFLFAGPVAFIFLTLALGIWFFQDKKSNNAILAKHNSPFSVDGVFIIVVFLILIYIIFRFLF